MLVSLFIGKMRSCETLERLYPIILSELDLFYCRNDNALLWSFTLRDVTLLL